MKRGLIILSFLICTIATAQVDVVSWKQYLKIQDKETEKVKVINFWATWCGPCVKELPVFEELNKVSSDSVEVILVSLDNKERLDEKVNPFVARKQMRSKIVLLNDIDFNKWMPKISTEWGGEIPVTLVIYKGEQLFHRGEITKEELERLIIKIKL